MPLQAVQVLQQCSLTGASAALGPSWQGPLTRTVARSRLAPRERGGGGRGLVRVSAVVRVLVRGRGARGGSGRGWGGGKFRYPKVPW